MTNKAISIGTKKMITKLKINEKKVVRKNKITLIFASLLLFFCLFISPAILPNFDVQAAQLTGLRDPAQGGLLRGTGDALDGGQSLSNLEIVVSRIIGGLTIVASIFFVVYFFLASFTWVTAGGDAGKIQKARDQMVQAALGLVVIILAYSIMGAIGTVLGINILNPAQQIEDIFFGIAGAQ